MKLLMQHLKPLTHNYYGEFASSTQNRAIPQKEDLLKKAPRRVLQVVKDITTLTKSAKVVGDVMGALHP